MPGALLRGMRPKQWLKNVLVFVAPVAAGTLFAHGVFVPTVVAFFAFSLAASGTLVNFQDVGHLQNPLNRDPAGS